MADSHKNFAYSTVATAPSPATTGTSLVVQAGEGTIFPAVPFNCTVWPADVQPLTTNAEIVRVTAISTDTFTITRAQESSTARSIGVGDQIANTITDSVLTGAEGATFALDNLASVAINTSLISDTDSTDDLGSSDIFWANAYIDTLTLTNALDHGGLAGLSDDDHTQYTRHNLSTAANDFLIGSGSNAFVKKTLAETGAILEGDINHDNLVGFASNEHYTQANIVATGVLNSGSINTGFGNIDIGASSLAAGSFDASEGNITNVGSIDLDLIRADAVDGSITIELDNAAGADLLVGNNNALVVEGDNDRVGIGISTPTATLDVRGPIEEGLMAWWPLDEGTGTSVADLSLNSNTGTLGVGTTTPTWVTGKFNKALDFDGTDDYVDLGTIGYDWDGNDWTTEIWSSMDAGTSNAYRGMIGNRFGAGSANWWTFGTASSDLIKLEYTGGLLIATDFAPTGSGWTHYTITKSGRVLSIYVNGLLNVSSDIGATDIGGTTNDLYLGRWFNSSQTWNGPIDEVRLYERALSAREIAEHYRQKAPSMAEGGTVDGELLVSSNVGIGIASPAAQLHIDQSSTTAAKPVITLDQADIDEDYFKIIGTSDTSVDRALVDAADFTTPGTIKGWLKINIQDDQGTNPIVDSDYYIPFYSAPTA